MNRTHLGGIAGRSFAAALVVVCGAAGGSIHAQEPPILSQELPPTLLAPEIPAQGWQAITLQSPDPIQQPIPAAQKAPNPPFEEEAVKNAMAPCIQPPEMVRIQDYDGPLKKVVGTFARPLERKAVHPPHFKPGARLCTLTVKGKFLLFVQDSLDPVTFLEAGFEAGLDQPEDLDHSYGQGAEGYGRRYGAEFAGEATSRFFGEFLYPSIFSEDPRYYRLAHGSARKRLLHAIEHVVVAHNDNGRLMFNFAEWLGTSSSVVLSNTYHPDNRRGFSAAAENVGYSFLQDVGFDVLREFWPEISRKLKLPFRGPDPASESALAGSR